MDLQRRGKNWHNHYRHLITSRAFILLCMLSFCLQAMAQRTLVKTYYAQSYYEEDGLASNAVHDMAQGKDGLLWFVTPNGISTFDGLRWKTFKKENALPPLFGKLQLLPTQEGGMLITGFSLSKFRLSYFRNNHWKMLPLPPDAETFSELQYSKIAAIEYAPNQFYVGLIYKKYLYLFNSATNAWQKFLLPSQTGDWLNISHIAFFQDQLYLFSNKNKGGVSNFNIERKAFEFDAFPSLRGKALLASTKSADGKDLYVLGENFVGCIRDGKYTTLVEKLYDQKPSFIGYSNILLDSHNRLFFNHNAALFKYNVTTGVLDPIKIDQPKSSDIPTELFEDREGNIWFCSMRGVKKVNSFRFHTLNKESGLVSDEISTILTLGGDSLLLGGNVGYSIYSQNNITNQPVSLSNYNASLNRVLDAIRSPDGKTYLAASSLGLGVLDQHNKVKWYSHPDEEIVNTVVYHQGEVLVGTFNGAFSSFKNGKFKPVWKKTSLYIRKIISDGEKLIFLTNQGVKYQDSKGLQSFRGKNLMSDNVYSLLRWKGRTLLGTMEGLSELVNGKIKKIKEPGMQIDRPIYAMLEDKQGRLWAGTDKGIFVHHKGHFINYNIPHGLAGKEINRHAFELMPNGEIWIGTDQGVSVYQPEDDIDQQILPVVRVTGIETIREGGSDQQQKLKLEYDNNTLAIFFQTISFHIPTELNYRYKLKGLDEEWIYSDNHFLNNVRYTNLPPGDYRFVVQARSTNGLWSGAARSKPIQVLSPFYTTWWFMLLVLASVISAGFALHAIVMHKRNAKQLRKAIEEKKKEIDKSERRFKAIWDATDTGIALINKRGKVLMINPAMRNILQVKENEAAKDSSILHLLPTPLFSESSISKMYSSKEVVRKNVGINLNGKALHLIITINFVDHLIPGESLMVVGCKDMTDQKLTEANNIRLNEELLRQNMSLLKKEEELANYNHELLQQREELEQALHIVEERNFELDQFVYKTSHDLRAPIASALGLLNIIQLEKDHSRLPEYLRLIGTSLEKQDTFIKSMLNFSKSTRAKNKPEGVNFEELINQCLQDLQHIPGFKEIRIQVAVTAATASFYSDKLKLYIILANIVSNSIKYRNPNVSSFLLIKVLPAESGINLIIEDNGIGIAPDYQQAIFEMFYRGTELSDGSGLGLYIVKQTVSKLRGHITVESSLGKGCCFTIYIPGQQKLNTSKSIKIKKVNPFRKNKPTL